MRATRRTAKIAMALIAPVALIALAASAHAQGAKPLGRCPIDAVISGTVCMDKFEASVWRVPNATGANAGLVDRIRSGSVKLADLTARGATQLGFGLNDDFAPCGDGGQSCTDDVYAVSLPGVIPSANVTWLQALAACENARKRLPTNAEWQAAVAGSPDPGQDNGVTSCNTGNAGKILPSGSRSACVSADGAFDMVGNVFEWVADWVPRSVTIMCGSWSPEVSPTGDMQCLVDAATIGEPGALARGGSFGFGNYAGPLTISNIGPTSSVYYQGFRCAR